MAGCADSSGNWSGSVGSTDTRWRELVKLGVPARMAGLGAVQDGPWRMAASPVVTMALSNAYWQKQGLRNITERYHQLRDT